MKTLGLSAFLCVGVHFLAAAVHASDGDTQSAEVAAGHSLHGDVFDEGPRQSAYLMGNTGKVHLAISTKALPRSSFSTRALASFMVSGISKPSALFARWQHSIRNARWRTGEWRWPT